MNSAPIVEKILNNILSGVIFGFIFSFIYVTSSFCFTLDDVPDTFSIKDIPECKDGCLRLIADHEQVGSLLKSPFNKGVYHFLDINNEQQLTLKLTNIAYGSIYQFDILDNTQTVIAKFEEQRNIKSGALMGFYIRTKNNKTTLISAVQNVFGTKHTIYEGNSWHVLAEISRPLFTWSRDSHISILDKSTLFSIIDPNVFAAALAFHCSSNYDLEVAPPEQSVTVSETLQPLYTKLTKISIDRGLTNDFYLISKKQLESAANTLNERYHQVYDDTNLNEDEKIEQFVNYGCDLIQSNAFNRIQEKAMIQFLTNRLMGL